MAVRKRKLSPVQHRRIVKLKLDKLSLGQIALQFRISRSSVQRIISSATGDGTTAAMRRQKVKRALRQTCSKLAEKPKSPKNPHWVIGPKEIVAYMKEHKAGLDLDGVAMPSLRTIKALLESVPGKYRRRRPQGCRGEWEE